VAVRGDRAATFRLTWGPRHGPQAPTRSSPPGGAGVLLWGAREHGPRHGPQAPTRSSPPGGAGVLLWGAREHGPRHGPQAPVARRARAEPWRASAAGSLAPPARLLARTAPAHGPRPAAQRARVDLGDVQAGVVRVAGHEIARVTSGIGTAPAVELVAVGVRADVLWPCRHRSGPWSGRLGPHGQTVRSSPRARQGRPGRLTWAASLASAAPLLYFSTHEEARAPWRSSRRTWQD
jgi:hypothetical protein